jgi:hypothetical protein
MKYDLMWKFIPYQSSLWINGEKKADYYCPVFISNYQLVTNPTNALQVRYVA